MNARGAFVDAHTLEAEAANGTKVQKMCCVRKQIIVVVVVLLLLCSRE